MNKKLLPHKSFHLSFILGILILSQSIVFAGQVVITPDETVSPVFHTSTAICKGNETHTHINLGFGTSVTGNDVFSDTVCCTIGGGRDNKASKSYDTVVGGFFNEASGTYCFVGGGNDNKASGYFATVPGGSNNRAGGNHSWAGGRNMQLDDTSDHTFAWGYADTAQTLSAGNAFLIFPSGTSGKVGIGTGSPNEILEVAGNGRAFFGDGGGSDRKGLLIDGIQGSSAARIEAYDYGEMTGMALVLNSVGGGNVGIDTTDPQYKLDVIGSIRATGSIYYGGSSGSANGAPYTKPDYVFEDGYQVLSTEQVAKHLKEQRSLPWITSLKQEQEENGQMIDMTRMTFETVETVENLQVQIIALSRTNKKQQKTIEEQQRLFENQQKTINQLRTDVEALRALIAD